MFPNPDRVSCSPRTYLSSVIQYHNEVTSTNDLAVAWAREHPRENIAIVAGVQTQGRGTRGRSWHSEAGASLLMSVVVPIARPLRPVLLTAWAACAVADVVEQQIGRRPLLKWPNDLLLEGQKLCGILIEQTDAVVLGVGLNLNQTAADFAQDGLTTAASLHMMTGNHVDSMIIAEQLLDALDRRFRAYLDGGAERNRLEADWRTLLGCVGQKRIIELHNGMIYVGILESITWENLTIDVPIHGRIHLVPELVKSLQPA